MDTAQMQQQRLRQGAYAFSDDSSESTSIPIPSPVDECADCRINWRLLTGGLWQASLQAASQTQAQECSTARLAAGDVATNSQSRGVQLPTAACCSGDACSRLAREERQHWWASMRITLRQACGQYALSRVQSSMPSPSSLRYSQRPGNMALKRGAGCIWMLLSLCSTQDTWSYSTHAYLLTTLCGSVPVTETSFCKGLMPLKVHLRTVHTHHERAPDDRFVLRHQNRGRSLT